MSAPLSHDLIVAGSGPAGVAAAIVAKEAGLPVALVDATDDDALKVGESLPGAVDRTLRRLGIKGLTDLLNPDEIKPCVANVSAWGSDEWSFTDAMASPEGLGWHVPRHRFDAALRKRASELGVERIHAKLGNIEVRDGTPHISLSADSPQPSAQLRGRFVLDATGRHAAICRMHGVKRERLSTQFAAVAWLHHPESDLDNTTRLKSVNNGWWYTARVPHGLRVLVFHGLPDEVAQMMKRPERFIEHCIATDLLPYALAPDHLVQPLRAMDASVQVTENVAGPGWMAVGDAALSFDPLSSQGVLFALYSGISAAEALIQCLARPHLALRSLEEYRQKVRSVLAANQRARSLFYSSELRYPESDYWRVQRQG